MPLLQLFYGDAFWDSHLFLSSLSPPQRPFSNLLAARTNPGSRRLENLWTLLRRGSSGRSLDVEKINCINRWVVKTACFVTTSSSFFFFFLYLCFLANVYDPTTRLFFLTHVFF